MDFITTGIIASSAYDIFKHGLSISAQALKERLGKWIKDDLVAQAVAAELEKAGVNSDQSESAITKRLDASAVMTGLVNEINASYAVVAPSTITNVTQTHSGSGDNVAGNKIVR